MASCKHWVLLVLTILAGCIFASTPRIHAESAKKIRAATGIDAGLCVLLGDSDGILAADLASQGRMVIHCLLPEKAPLAKIRKAIGERVVYGLATADAVRSFQRLPYADNLVNLLICDTDELGKNAPAQAEITRVLCPLGVAYLKKGGAWSKTVRPMPGTMDGWTLFYHGPDGNPVSQDEGIGAPTGLQWIAGSMCMGADPTTGFRLAGGRALYEWNVPATDRKSKPTSLLVCRDAFSGVLLWTKPTTLRAYKTRPIVMTDERVYTYLDIGGPLVALDARSGELVRTYEQGGRTDKKIAGSRSDVNLILHNDLLVQTAGNSAYVLDAESGALKWKHAEAEGKFVDYPTVNAATGQVFITAGLTPRDAGRYPGADARAILAFDLKTGKSQWRCEMGRELSQLCFVDDALYAFNLAGFIGRPRDLFLARINPKDGSIVWKINPGAKGQFLDFSIINGKIYVMSLGLQVFDAAKGEQIAAYPMPGNSRCEMSRASKNHLLMSFGNFIDLATEPLELQRCEISRGSCGTGNTPGYGMLFYNPNRCHCFVSVRGYLAASREKSTEPIPDEDRLQSSLAKLPPPEKRGKTWPEAADWPIYLGNPQRGSSTPTAIPINLKPLWKEVVQAAPNKDNGPIPGEAFQSSHFNGPVTAASIAVGKVFVAVPEAHRVEALDAKTGKNAWQFTAGGRVDTPPTIYDGLCLFGCRDGYVYALNAADGSFLWRFFAAPYERKIIAHNQCESTWPLFGSVAMVEGTLVACAGRHPEVNSGIHAYGLDPYSGKMQWKQIVGHERKPGILGKKIPDEAVTTKRYGYNANTVLNEVLITEGKLTSMTGLILDGTTGEITNPPWPKKVPGKPQALPVHPMSFYLDLGFRQPYRNQQLENYGGPGADHGSWVFRLAKEKLEVHGELIAFNSKHVAAVKVAGIDWALWDITNELPDAKGPGRQNSSHPPHYFVPRFHFKTMDVKAVILAGDVMVLGLSSPRQEDGASVGAIRLYSTQTGAPIGEIPLDSGVIQAGVSSAGGRLYVSCDDGSVRCFGE